LWEKGTGRPAARPSKKHPCLIPRELIDYIEYIGYIPAPFARDFERKFFGAMNAA
jgi:hypothetical protein